MVQRVLPISDVAKTRWNRLKGEDSLAEFRQNAMQNSRRDMANPMTHVSQFTFEADGVDISAGVERWDWRHGNAVFTNDRGPSFFNPSGLMVLENLDGGWTESRLEALSQITAKNDGVTIGQMGIRSFDSFPDRYIVQLRLESVNADAYDQPTHHMAITDITEGEVLSRASVTITNQSAWNGYVARRVYGILPGAFRLVESICDIRRCDSRGRCHRRLYRRGASHRRPRAVFKHFGSIALDFSHSAPFRTSARMAA